MIVTASLLAVGWLAAELVKRRVGPIGVVTLLVVLLLVAAAFA